MDRDLPSRKPNRLKYYDYGRRGAYFITICTDKRKNLFWKSLPDSVGANCVRPSVSLTPIGKIAEEEIDNIESVYKNIVIRNYVVMPNHIHLLISIKPSAEDHITVSRIVKQFKGAVSKRVGFSIWQKSFHDHVIRNSDDFNLVWKYIKANPVMWKDDSLYNGQ